MNNVKLLNSVIIELLNSISNINPATHILPVEHVNDAAGAFLEGRQLSDHLVPLSTQVLGRLLPRVQVVKHVYSEIDHVRVLKRGGIG